MPLHTTPSIAALQANLVTSLTTCHFAAEATPSHRDPSTCLHELGHASTTLHLIISLPILTTGNQWLHEVRPELCTQAGHRSIWCITHKPSTAATTCHFAALQVNLVTSLTTCHFAAEATPSTLRSH
jgi:hypothetical protein